MIKKTVFIILLFGMVTACKETEPRWPVQQKSGSFFKESVKRSQQILAQERALVQTIIKKDTAHRYFENPNGFWYFYEKKNDSLEITPEADDEAVLAYSIMSFEGDTLYTFDEIGVQQIMIDKTKLFPGLRNAIKILKEGERATFFFPSSQAYGYKGDNNRIGANVPLRSSLELIKINKSIDSSITNTLIE